MAREYELYKLRRQAAAHERQAHLYEQAAALHHWVSPAAQLYREFAGQDRQQASDTRGEIRTVEAWGDPGHNQQTEDTTTERNLQMAANDNQRSGVGSLYRSSLDFQLDTGDPGYYNVPTAEQQAERRQSLHDAHLRDEAAETARSATSIAQAHEDLQQWDSVSWSNSREHGDVDERAR